MGTETELKLAIAPGAARRLAAHPALATAPSSRYRLRNTYFDTPELTLRDRRIALRFRQRGRDWLLTVKSAEPASGGLAQRREWEYPAIPDSFDFAPVDDPALRDLLDECRPRLQAAFTTDFTRQAWMLEPRPGCRIEVALDQGWITADGRRERLCELELELLAGTASDLYALALTLQAELALRPVAASKAERGFALATASPGTPFRAPTLRLSPDTAPVDAFRTVAFSAIDQILRNEAGVLAGNDPEFLHQTRVALRRLRAALGLWRPLLPEAFTAHWSAGLKTMANALGAARNWDVIAEELLPPFAAAFASHPALPPLRRRIDAARARARREARAAVAAGDWGGKLLRLAADIHALPKAPTPTDLRQFARERLARRRRTIRRLTRADLTHPETAHRLRIACKKLRYALESLGAAHAPDGLAHRLRRLASWQDRLGRLNDQAVAAALMRDLGPAGDLLQGWLCGLQAAGTTAVGKDARKLRRSLGQA